MLCIGSSYILKRWIFSNVGWSFSIAVSNINEDSPYTWGENQHYHIENKVKSCRSVLKNIKYMHLFQIVSIALLIVKSQFVADFLNG